MTDITIDLVGPGARLATIKAEEAAASATAAEGAAGEAAGTLAAILANDLSVGSLGTVNTILSTDDIILLRGGVGKVFTGTLFAIDAVGNFGIGKTPTTTLDVNGPIKPGIGVFSAGAGRFYSTAAYGLVVNGGNGSALDFAITSRSGNFLFSNPANTENVLINSANSGLLLVGTTTGSAHTIARGSAQNDLLLAVTGSANPCASFYSGFTTMGANAAAAVLKLGYNSTTSRSISSGGTINASGADGAEYITKSDGCGVVAKGDVCGIDADGKVTKSWASAISYGVKSSSPGLVLGDNYAAHLGPEPEQEEDETDEVFAARQVDFVEALEEARQGVDRIAFWGRVPVNVDEDTLAACVNALADGVGIYLVASANGGGIKAVAVPESEMTLPLYMRRLGKVWAIRDGHPIIDVQHG